MVGKASKRLVRAVKCDLRAFYRQMTLILGPGHTPPGLHTWRFEDVSGKTRLHLRVHGDGSSDLFVNVSNVVHLTSSATEIARMLLDGLGPEQIKRLMAAWHPEASREELREDVETVSAIVCALREPGEGCPTCLPEFHHTSLFSARARAPYKADLALTYACNNDCTHCYNEPERRNTPSLDLRGWRRVLRRLADIGVPHIIFTGGEPTLHGHLPALIRYADKLGQVTGLNTNGRRLADASYVARLARAGLDHVQITLASHLPDIHNDIVKGKAFEETVQGVRNALAAGLHTITNTTLTRRNRSHAGQIVEFVKGLGVTTFAMNGMICSGRGWCNPDALSELELIPVLDEVKELADDLGLTFLWYTPTEYCRLSPLDLDLGPKSCNAAEYSICIEPNGDVLPCQSYYHAAGNLLHDEWPDIWNSQLFRSIRMRRENPRAAGLPEKCFDCPDLRVCGGGCPLQRAERSEEAVIDAARIGECGAAGSRA